jgi:hypothetical protein
MASPDDDERILAVPLVEHGGDRFPKDISLEPSADRYIGFYQNQHGEQIVFVRERGQEPQLFHGDFGWSPLEAVWPEISTAIPLAHWVSGQLILDQAEVLWLAACLQASRWLGDEAVGSEAPLDRLALQLVQGSAERQREDFDRRWELKDVALQRWREGQASQPTHGEDHYAEGAILVSLGINTKQRKPREGVTKEIRQRIEGEAAEVVRSVGS